MMSNIKTTNKSGMESGDRMNSKANNMELKEEFCEKMINFISSFCADKKK